MLQKLTGHISEASNQSKLNFGSLWAQLVCQFPKNLKGCRFCFVDLVWNDPVTSFNACL